MRCLPAVAAMLLLPGVLAAQNAAPTQNAAPAAPALATAQRGVVIASEKAASDAGLAVLRRGGSAADAAIASAWGGRARRRSDGALMRGGRRVGR